MEGRAGGSAEAALRGAGFGARDPEPRESARSSEGWGAVEAGDGCEKLGAVRCRVRAAVRGGEEADKGLPRGTGEAVGDVPGD